MPETQHWSFGPFRLDPSTQSLWRHDTLLPLPPKPFAVLAYLVAHAGQVVTKDALFAAVWPATHVTESALTTCLGQIRQVLGETARSPQYIATLNRRGYRFIAPVVAAPAAGLAAPAVALPATPDLARPPEGAGPPLVLAAAERRHLTVLFCDLVGSTALSGCLDPAESHEIAQAYHQACAAVVQRFDGTIAQYLGDGVLVYFGYPVAHEDDAQRAVRAGLALLEACAAHFTSPTAPAGAALTVRLGVHTGLVVVNAPGEEQRQVPLVLGETPHIAVRLPHLAAANTLLISAATHQLVAGYFRCKALGTHVLPGLGQALKVYQVLSASETQSRLAVSVQQGLTPLVGRTQEMALLTERWTYVTEGLGQVVLLTGEAGIGKSRLVQVLKAHVTERGQGWLECQGSPYYQHTALYPLSELLERAVLRWERQASPQQKLASLEACLRQYAMPLADGVPLLAALLSLPLPATYTPPALSPDQQKQRTLQALLTLLLRLAAMQPLLLVVEDLHWVDPSTLEWLTLLVEQGPTSNILLLCTSRPDFQPPWPGRAHLTQLTLPRLPQAQSTVLVEQVAYGKTLPPEVLKQIVAKTDGVPLFIEEMTKTVLESGLLLEHEDAYSLIGPLPPVAIPATLHDTLLARLDRLGTAKGLAQLGATLGRQFGYALLQAVAPWDETTVQQGLQHLVAAELLYQRGLPPEATYVFKHALIQEAAYQSLLSRTRQQYHARIAQTLEAQFPDTVAAQPELLAQHYTAAGLGTQAVPYWLAAGQRASQRSAYVEAQEHLTTGLALLQTLPDTPERLAHEVALHLALGPVLMALQGFTSPAVEQTYTRARLLAQGLQETPQRFPTLLGLWLYFWMSCTGGLQPARELATALFAAAQQQDDTALLLQAHVACGLTCFFTGELRTALAHLEAGQALYDPQQHHDLTFRWGYDVGMACFSYGGATRWLLGYPEQALTQCVTALRLAQEVQHPFSVACAHLMKSVLHHWCRDPLGAQEEVSVLLEFAARHHFPDFLAQAPLVGRWADAALGRRVEGVTQLSESLIVQRAMGIFLGLLADACRLTAQPAAGLGVISKALALTAHSGEALYTAELYRLQGELVLQMRRTGPHQAAELPSPEACFQRALSLTRQQQAKAWELRAAMSLARLWQQQGQRAEARALLAPVYAWFTEGFDTPDLQESRTLLEALG